MIKKENFIGYSNHEYCPVIRELTKALLLETIKKKKPQKLLEIGTFVGYSSAVMLEASETLEIISLEKDPQNVKDAKQNLKNLGFEKRAEVVCCDAIDYLETHQDEKFDFVFLDGPKGQYFKYLPYIKKMLNDGGVLFADDILYYGLVNSEEKIIHKHRSIVNNLRKFIDQIKSDESFDTQIYDIEDGVSISIKK